MISGLYKQGIEATEKALYAEQTRAGSAVGNGPLPSRESSGEIVRELEGLFFQIGLLDQLTDQVLERSRPVRREQAVEGRGADAKDAPPLSPFGDTLRSQCYRIRSVNERLQYVLATLELP
jgi:hypothetical protein